jgi:uncharacterized protein (TIGR02466 family)
MFNERIFSVGITKFQINNFDNQTLCKQVEYFCTNPHNKTVNKRDMGLDNPHLIELNKVVLQQSQLILNGLTSNPNVEVYLQRVWGNHNVNENICSPHVHRESFLSAVYYPKSTDGRIQFYSPFTDAILSHVPVVADKYHEFNSSQHTVYPKTGWLILFPANLLHVVLPSKEERHSIVYDIGVKLI